MSENKTLALAEPSVAMMLQKVIDKGITAENVSALEALVGLYDRMKAKDAEKEYSEAFAKLQSSIKKIQAIHPVPAKDGTIKYHVSKFSEVWSEVEPHIKSNGFTVSFSQKYEEGLPLRVTTTFILQHIYSGHKTETGFTVRVGSGPPGSSDFQADGAASSYAKMRAMCSRLNIIIEHDDDARMIGSPIGKALAEDLEKRVKAVGADEHAFMKYAGINVSTAYPVASANYEQISDERWPILDELLKRKEAAKAARKAC